MWLPLMVSTSVSKLGLPNGMAMIGLIDVVDERRDHGAERDADDERDGELNDVALVEKVTKALHMLSSCPAIYVESVA